MEKKTCQNVNLRRVSSGCVYSIALGMTCIHRHDCVSYRYPTQTNTLIPKKNPEITWICTTDTSAHQTCGFVKDLSVYKVLESIHGKCSVSPALKANNK